MRGVSRIRSNEASTSCVVWTNETMKNKPTETMTAKANLIGPSHLSRQTRVIQVLFPFLRHLNAGTLSVVMMVGLALLDAMRDTHPAPTNAAVDNAMIVRMATDVSTIRLGTSTVPGFQEITCFPEPIQSSAHSSGSHRLDQRTPEHPCSAFARSSACLL
jgi:hypothetical protein